MATDFFFVFFAGFAAGAPRALLSASGKFGSWAMISKKSLSSATVVFGVNERRWMSRWPALAHLSDKKIEFAIRLHVVAELFRLHELSPLAS